MTVHSVRRTGFIVFAIVAAGAFAGAIAGGLVALALDLLISGSPSSDSFEVFGIGAAIGGVLGSVLAPTAAFGFLRRVPIWRLFAETAVGAVLGGVRAGVLRRLR